MMYVVHAFARSNRKLHARRTQQSGQEQGDLTGFPPTFLSVGGTEILLKDSLTFARNAAKAGCDVRLHVGKDMIHTYPLDLWDYPEAMTAFEEMELFLRQILR